MLCYQKIEAKDEYRGLKYDHTLVVENQLSFYVNTMLKFKGVLRAVFDKVAPNGFTACRSRNFHSLTLFEADLSNLPKIFYSKRGVCFRFYNATIVCASNYCIFSTDYFFCTKCRKLGSFLMRFISLTIIFSMSDFICL